MSVGFFAVFDDIATLLDDAAAMSKVATQKTVGILGDDLAVNAQKASGFASSRELPVLWAITKGSFKNKLIILPLAFILSAFAPWSIIPILMFGGVYLAYEGGEKVLEYFGFHNADKHDKRTTAKTEAEILLIEKSKIKSAIRTDFILSIEIVIMALGTVLDQSLPIQIIAVTFVAFLATVGVYGIVALLVRMDDFGLHLIDIAKDTKPLLKKVGETFVVALPKIIRILTFFGTLAMFLVAGGIFMHNVVFIHHTLAFMPSISGELLFGFILGMISVGLKKLIEKNLSI
ncbi:DUF808 domain-containing protein [Sulfurimonas sp. SAG-AH-194-L11]|nr:DUF808 domain-containing protein [Sulfurimonas sp. SAG-AH-194-L11]MDF1877136.1 DUF808 domain-containing protein [Sulfurimonas sp. SAG-AH-194-L11]